MKSAGKGSQSLLPRLHDAKISARLLRCPGAPPRYLDGLAPPLALLPCDFPPALSPNRSRNHAKESLKVVAEEEPAIWITSFPNFLRFQLTFDLHNKRNRALHLFFLATSSHPIWILARRQSMGISGFTMEQRVGCIIAQSAKMALSHSTPPRASPETISSSSYLTH
ncbi:hypothetical protein KSP40_PGU000264 [Platanthera guangdongensis]|uniref:Uncharacterized protein n=1 Tax=Platanthera guangdongensis TaxID=2320717 RepID=A0ABR2MYR7_9ASPA